MEIGQKVRFLNEVGGGRISGFQSKGIVLVEDEDGFEIPMLESEVVVIDTDDYNMAKVNTGATNRPSKQLAGTKTAKTPDAEAVAQYGFQDEEKRPLGDDEDYDPADRPITFKVKPQERPNANLINLYLAFIDSDDQKGLEENDKRFEAYLINDCNYYLTIQYLSAEGASWKVRQQLTLEPNTKQYVESIKRSELQELEHLCVQCMAYKQDKPFQLKPIQSVQLRLDQVKFYKANCFQASPFFRQPALLVDVVRDDKAVRQVFVNAEELQEALLTPKQRGEVTAARVSQEKLQKKQTDVLEVDLHIEQLLDNLTGLSAGDILLRQMKEFHKVMDEHIKHAGQKIVFIHGKGDGVLRKNILQDLKYRYKKCTWQDASFQEYGYGATLVKIG